MFDIEEEIKNYFLNQKKIPFTNKALVELFELALKSQHFSEGFKGYRERFLVAKLVLSSIYQFFFEYNQQEFDFGIELKKKNELRELYLQHLQRIPRKSKEGEIEIRKFFDFTTKDVLFFAYSFYYFDFEREILLFFVVPSSLENPKKCFREVFELIRNTYLYEPTQKEFNFIPVYSQFVKHLKKKILSYPYQNQTIQGILTVFEFEDLKLYSERMGEQFTTQVLVEISKIIRNHLKRNDLLYNISRKIFIAYLPDCDEAGARKRFENLFFKIEPLIIRFQVNYYFIDKEIVVSEENLEKLLSRLY